MLLKNIRCEFSRYDLVPVYQENMNTSYNAFKAHGIPDLISSPIYDGPYSNDHILGKTDSVRYQNIMVYGPKGMSMPKCSFGGQDSEHCNHNIVLESFMLNGTRLKPEELTIEKSEYSVVNVK